MRKNILSVLILLSLSLSVFSLIFFLPSMNAEMVEETPEGDDPNNNIWFTTETVDSGGVAEPTSIALDSNGFPHIVYYKSMIFRHAYYNGTSWSLETVDTDAGWYGCSIDIDSYDFPHIAYIVENMTEDARLLKYAYYDGESWTIQLIDGGESEHCLFPSLSLDSKNRPHITYTFSSLYAPNSTLKYAHYNGSTWNFQTINAPGPQSMAIDSYDKPHIAYCKGSFTNQSIVHAYFDGASWINETIDGEVSGIAWGEISIAIDSRDNPHISYRKGGLKYSYFNGASWNLQIIPGTERDIVYHSSISLDSHDNPHISYMNITEKLSDRSLRYAYYNGTLWNVKTVDVGDAGHGNSIALDSKNNSHISYVYNSDLRYALGISDKTPPILSINSPSMGAIEKSSSVKVSWSGSDAGSGIDHYEVQLDEESWVNVGNATSHTFSELSDGSHSVRVKAVDKMGNSNEDQVTFTVNTSFIGGPGWTDDGAIVGGTAFIIALAIIFVVKRKA